LASGGRPGAALLKKRMEDAAESMQELRNQQQRLAQMLNRIATGAPPAAVNKQLWIEMLQAAGMDQAAMDRWHAEFERRAPNGHRDFLVSLGIPEEEIARIRQWSQQAAQNSLAKPKIGERRT